MQINRCPLPWNRGGFHSKPAAVGNITSEFTATRAMRDINVWRKVGWSCEAADCKTSQEVKTQGTTFHSLHLLLGYPVLACRSIPNPALGSEPGPTPGPTPEPTHMPTNRPTSGPTPGPASGSIPGPIP